MKFLGVGVVVGLAEDDRDDEVDDLLPRFVESTIIEGITCRNDG